MEHVQKTTAAPEIRWLSWVALLFNGFAILVVNYWIYTARWTYIERNNGPNDWPPTISRAISDPLVGVPFAFWITVSAVCLVIGVLALVANYWRGLASLGRPTLSIRGLMWLVLPGILALQVSSAVGMHWLSVYRFPDAHEAHMVGSYTFFVSQALVVLLFTIFNAILLRNTNSLANLIKRDELRSRWVRFRFWFGVACLVYTCIYGALFVAKGTATFGTSKAVYVAYVSAEPTLISAFLLLLLLCHVDIFARRND